MYFFHQYEVFATILLAVLPTTCVADVVNSGFDVYEAAQVMMSKASHSWEWGTAAEALLELYNNEISVFSSNPFPNGKIPSVSANTLALSYAKQFISTELQVLVPDLAVGDPASLGVSAILLGTSDSKYTAAAQRQADYILNQAPKWSNGAISHRGDVAEIWADNMAMSFPFLAYMSVQQNSVTMMAETVKQCGLQRDVLKASGTLNWRHIIGPQSQDTGLWATGNGWAAFGMARVLNTLQKWSGSSGMTSEAAQLKGWIKEILDGAMISSLQNGLLYNYLDDASWFGEISGTALLSAVAYRMAVNDPGMFPQKYIDWADTNRKSLSTREAGGIFSPAVDPYNWLSRKEYVDGSPEGQAFMIYLYTAYRDCVDTKVCAPSTPTATTISNPGIGPIDILTVLDYAITFSSMPSVPTGCGPPQSCDLNGCAGSFDGLAVHAQCTAGPQKGCQCKTTPTTCGPRQSCDMNGCAGAFNGLSVYPQCTGNFVGCNCTVTAKTCGPHQSCDLNGCAGAFDGISVYPKCTGNFVGCECTAGLVTTCGETQSCDLNGCAGKFSGLTPLPQCSGNFVGCDCDATSNTCGQHQSCDLNGCAGAFPGLTPYAECTRNFIGCECTATPNTCGPHQSCDLNGCNGKFLGSAPYAQCTSNFVGCECSATANTCGPRQSCDLNNCNGKFLSSTAFAQCTSNFIGCECSATPNTCGPRQSCDMNGCNGAFWGSAPYPRCTNNFYGCECQATGKTCGAQQSCDNNGCAGKFDLSNGLAYCSGNFVGCQCQSTINTCGRPQSCDGGNCNGRFLGLDVTPQCTGFFKGCQCTPTSTTCGASQSCDLNGCAGTYDSSGVARCSGNFKGCACTASPKTCGVMKNCDLNGCNGKFLTSQGPPTCTGNFAGCPCLAVSSTCGGSRSCSAGGCNGAITPSGSTVCLHNFFGCPCTLDPVQPGSGGDTPPPPPQGPSGPSPICVTAHCFNYQSILEGDSITVQFYSSSQYLFLLQAGKRWASPDTSFYFNNIVDPNGNTWNIQLDGNCGRLSYSSSLQQTQGTIYMGGGARQHLIELCEIGTLRTRCGLVESTYLDSTCPGGSAPPLCDYRTYCSAYRPGDPKIEYGSTN
ncbi:hypothetical protein BKA61DRAFT_694331 [Leptodontidium sp. MPI-SDFR-AT-0119]|nr:hypothetical protein BKA61DRAFT_694331 [Leptodontidium sp. MPI-SDFR-AT-0119]